MQYHRKNYRISDDRKDIQLDKVEALLKKSYWANARSSDAIRVSIENSICFSVFVDDEQIGFARVVTDFASVAYIADIIINSKYRAKGLGKWLVEIIVNDTRWQSLFKILATDDAHGLYERHGFSCSGKLMGTKK